MFPREVLLEDHEVVASEQQVTLHYESMTADEDQSVTGMVESLRNASEYNHEQIQADSGWFLY